MSLDQDWQFLRAAMPDVREYLLSNVLYWSLNASGASGASLPQLTLGNFLLAQARLSALSLNSAQAEELADIAHRIHALREEWKSNWGLKAGVEFSARLHLWQSFIQDLRGEAASHQGIYAQKVTQRAILRLLQPEMIQGTPAHEQDQLNGVDQILRGLSQHGSFVWEPEVQPGFPEEGFWFLYVTLGAHS